MHKADINLVCDYIIQRVLTGDEKLNILKLQKLLYYVQAWHLAFHRKPLFKGKFEAWVHGPVNLEIYKRYKDTHSLYSAVNMSDANTDGTDLDEDQKMMIDSVLDVYAGFTGTQLEELTHREEPWLKARGDRHPAERCSDEISEEVMKTYYSSRIA